MDNFNDDRRILKFIYFEVFVILVLSFTNSMMQFSHKRKEFPVNRDL